MVALLLERDPTLDPAQAKALLRAHSQIPGKPAGSFDPKWGHGLIDLSGMAAGALFPQTRPGGILTDPDGEWVEIGGLRLRIRSG